jgi:hypothetical protein
VFDEALSLIEALQKDLLGTLAIAPEAASILYRGSLDSIAYCPQRIIISHEAEFLAKIARAKRVIQKILSGATLSEAEALL